MYVVLADLDFCGLYRSLSAAERLRAELDALPVNFHHKPAVLLLEDVEEYINCRPSSFQYLVEAVECGWYGRSRYALG